MSNTGEIRLRNILEKATQAVEGEKQQAYGEVRKSFQKIADKWNVTLSDSLMAPITAEDVALMMIDFKTVREKHRHDEDNLKDIAGYTLCLEKLEQGRVNHVEKSR